MAKLFGPVHSESASGSIGESLTYSQRNSGAQVRYQRKQKDFLSVLRTAQRAKFSLGLDLWNSMPDVEKNYWKSVEKYGYVTI